MHLRLSHFRGDTEASKEDTGGADLWGKTQKKKKAKTQMYSTREERKSFVGGAQTPWADTLTAEDRSELT